VSFMGNAAMQEGANFNYRIRISSAWLLAFTGAGQ